MTQSAPVDGMFRKVLIANRGEIARRVQRGCRALGVQTVAVYSEADASAPFVKEADEAICIGAPPPKESYLVVEKILQAAKDSGAQAIHPGYGFLSESDALLKGCEQAGLTFIGPPAQAMATMGSKLAARAAMVAAGVPVVPGSEEAIADEDEAVKQAEAIGFPVMLKISGGGGGIGMVLCKKEKKLRKSFADAKRKGESFFGNADVYLEKAITEPHHVEVQVLGDSHGHVVHLFERECSVQRRHQKVLEESPSPFLDDDTRKKLCETAVRAAQAVGYQGAGTVEFIAAADRNFYFLEMNTRLQVEHPVTEMVLDLDLVALQLRVAAGEALPFTQEELVPKGHAIELRICAEDPEKRFFPSPGQLEQVRWPSGEGIRVDSGVETGSVVPPYYDSLLAKLIGHGASRQEAIARLLKALEQTELNGLTTNLALHSRILRDETFVSGQYTTAYLADVLGLKS